MFIDLKHSALDESGLLAPGARAPSGTAPPSAMGEHHGSTSGRSSPGLDTLDPEMLDSSAAFGTPSQEY